MKKLILSFLAMTFILMSNTWSQNFGECFTPPWIKMTHWS